MGVRDGIQWIPATGWLVRRIEEQLRETYVGRKHRIPSVERAEDNSRSKVALKHYRDRPMACRN